MSPPWAPLLRYHPELEHPEWDEEGEYKSPYLVDGEGRKIRSAGGYAILAIENEETKSMIEKYQKKKNLELPNVPITQDLENDVDVILHKRRELIENRHNAVYVEDRTLHIELWNLISATLLVLAAIPKERPEEGVPLRDWPSAVRDTWRLVQRNHREKRRLSVGWQSASSVTGADGTAISQYNKSTSDEEQNIEGGRMWEELFAQRKIGVIRKEQLEEFVEETGDEGTRTNARMILQDMPSVYHYRLDVLAYRIMGLHGVTKALNIFEGFMDKKKSIPVKLRRTVASEIAECRNHVAKLHGLYGLLQVPTENLEANL
ncbi:hypothetical protein FRC03_004289 [Tulasnella sp. 419]|nr:hypothetical protein FRC03_004289 [Tulasnella sp. 419]